MDNLEALKEKLRNYEKEDIRFNEPHFTLNLVDRGGNRQEAVKMVLNPENLTDFKVNIGKYGDLKYELHFPQNSGTVIIPVIFDRRGRKELYIMTYIMRYRK